MNSEVRVALVAQFDGRVGRELRLAHRDARADEGAHHAVAERVGLHLAEQHAVGRRATR